MKKILFVTVLSFVLFSCGNNPQKVDTSVETKKEAVKLTISELLENPDKYVDQKIIVSGTVDHVCKNGGKKMFILGINPDNRLKITTGEDISVFEVDLEGSDVTVEGIFTELTIDEEYLVKLENELNKEKEEHAVHDESVEHTHEGEQSGDVEHDESAEHTHDGEQSGDKEHTEGLDQISTLRNHIKESGENHISQYSVKCISYLVKAE